MGFVPNESNEIPFLFDIQKIEDKYKKSQVVDVRSGDTVRVHQKIKEGSKERIQVFEGMVIIKTTENRRAFIKNFLENYVQYYNETIYFFVLENNFGCDSNLVDNSFIRVKEIVEELSVFFEYFNPIMEFPTIKIIEMKGFENYFIETINGFSKIQKYH